jgi:hypothetical protein
MAFQLLEMRDKQFTHDATSDLSLSPLLPVAPSLMLCTVFGCIITKTEAPSTARDMAACPCSSMLFRGELWTTICPKADQSGRPI